MERLIKKIGAVSMTNVDLVYKGLPRWMREGEELYSEGFEMLLGGGYPATLIHLAGLGFECKLCTYLGKDVFSEFACREMRSYGLEPVNVYRGDGVGVNLSTVMLTPGERTIATYTAGEASCAETEEKIYNALKGSELVLAEPLKHAEVYGRLKDEGAVIVLDTGWDDELGYEKYGEYLKLADYFTPNTKEACKLTGKEDPFEALDELSGIFARAVVKLDKGGSAGKENGKTVVVKEIEEFRCVDATGAGDNFLAGFVYGIAHGLGLGEILLAGNATGGKCVSEIGCIKGRLNEKELGYYMEKYRANIAWR